MLEPLGHTEAIAKRGHSMRTWFRRMALKRTYHRLRAFEATATREDIAEFARALRQAPAPVTPAHVMPAPVTPDGRLLVDVRDARAIADACDATLRQRGRHSRGERMALETTRAVLGYLACAAAGEVPEVRFMASLLAEMNAAPAPPGAGGDDGWGRDARGAKPLTAP